MKRWLWNKNLGQPELVDVCRRCDGAVTGDGRRANWILLEVKLNGDVVAATGEVRVVDLRLQRDRER